MKTIGETPTTWSTVRSTSRHTMHRLSFLVGILPFVEQQAMWETISNPSVDDEGESWPAMGPSPVTIRYAPWASNIPTYRCPAPVGSHHRTHQLCGMHW